MRAFAAGLEYPGWGAVTESASGFAVLLRAHKMECCAGSSQGIGRPAPGGMAHVLLCHSLHGEAGPNGDAGALPCNSVLSVTMYRNTDKELQLYCIAPSIPSPSWANCKLLGS